jgi:hypothetical protein
MILKLLLLPFAVAFDAGLAVLEASPPHKRFKNGSGYHKPRMMDALKDTREDDPKP